MGTNPSTYSYLVLLSAHMLILRSSLSLLCSTSLPSTLHLFQKQSWWLWSQYRWHRYHYCHRYLRIVPMSGFWITDSSNLLLT
ncbi:hypothetical protein PR003_g18394 [Phytophthora rubi]|uniref:Secreted protein n=1 Tax=Phytophthora rubi TaxID=129364 RepID=A0A6A3KIE5_9STRA|nr:hypothetical protein PR001_g17197 [Phytophthora rubi]KAE9007942.1 hypothetical protein PR002_g16054 [Phytophthora rubi]KAE9317802.1 hypothetical protein PR003_g18394 [Phytophthora rubi]